VPPLQKQVIPVSMFGGLDTKSDPHQVMAGSWLELENFNFESPKALRTRNGYASRSHRLDDGGEIFAGTSIAAYLEELLVTDRTSLYSRNDALDSLSFRGPLSSVACAQRPIIRNNRGQNQADSATDPVTGQQISAWEDSSGGVHYNVITANGLVLVADRVLAETGVKPKTLVVGTSFVILFVDVDDAMDPVLKFAVLSVGAPTGDPEYFDVVGSPANQHLNVAKPNYDACVLGQSLFIAINDRAAGGDQGITLFIYQRGIWTVPQSDQYAGHPAHVLTIFPDGSTGGVLVGFYDGTAAKWAAFSAAPSFITSGTLEILADVISITGVNSSTAPAPRDASFYYGVSAAKTRDYLTRTVLVLGDVAGTPEVFRRSASPCAKAFLEGDHAYVPLAYQSAVNNSDDPNLQSQYLVVDGSKNHVARVLYGLAGGIPMRPDNTTGAAMLAETCSPSPGVWKFAGLVKDLQTTLFKRGYQANVPVADPENKGNFVYIYSQLGVTALSFDFRRTPASHRRAELADTLNYSGGVVTGYDGVQTTPNNFLVYPEPFDVQITDVAGGGLLAGLHRYLVCYAWTDGRGQVHRSSPSIPIPITIAQDGSYTTLTIPTDRLTNKPGMVIEVYRTVIVESVPSLVYYKVTTTEIPAASGATNAPIFNNPDIDTVTFVDKMNETAPQGRPQIYTTGGVFANQAPNPLGALTVLHNRIFGIDQLYPRTLWYSKQVLPGAPVEFTPWQTLNMDPRGGDVTALGPLDNVLIAFKKGSIFRIVGNGPDSAGGNFDFQDAELITTDVGCESPRSVVIVPDLGEIPGGLMFQAANGKGLHLLTRSYQVIPIGAPVAAYANEEITSATLMADKKQVVFTLGSGGRALVYDYFVKLWTTYTNVDAADSTVWQGRHVFVKPNGGIRIETPGVYTDDGAFISCYALSSWFAWAGIGGFGRLYKLLLLGLLRSSHQLFIGCQYDYVPYGPNTETIEVTPPATNQWGADSVWGGNPLVPADTKVWGGDFPQYRFRIGPKHQKCSAFRFSLRTQQTPGGDPGEAALFSAVSFEVGLIPGADRTPASRTFGRGSGG
jgi:hypothetical protein